MDNIVTFTTKVKEEICSLLYKERELLSILSGFVKVNGSLTLSKDGMSLSLKTENSKVAKFIYNAFKKLFKVVPSYSYSKKMKFKKGNVFGIHVNSNVMEILEQLELMKDGMTYFPREIVLEDRLRYFITGAFLSSGSINSPTSKNYHLQMVVSDEEDARYFLKLLNRFRNEKAMNFKIISKRNKYVLYLKKADQIATFLALCQSVECLMEFENIRIEKDFINSDNRIQVCYNANYQKSLNNGSLQCEEIKFLMDIGADLSMNNKEQLIMQIRLENPDASLVQVADILNEVHGIKLSKSGVNHIFKKIHEKYVELSDE